MARLSGASPGKSLRSFIQYSNLRLILLCILISTYGCLLVNSAALGAGGSTNDVIVQIVASFGGLLLALLISRVDYESICAWWPIWAAASLLLVLLTFTPLGLNVAGTDDTAWLGLRLGSFSLTFQPSELMKIGFIISFSVHLTKAQSTIHRFKTVLLLGLHAAVPIGLVFLQGDDGTALVFITIFLSMLLAAGVNLLYYVAGLAAVCAGVPILWSFLTEDKKARFLCILPPYVEKYLGTEGWQQYEALKAIGSGQLSGTGYLQTSHGTLFARNNDFVFTVAGEEFGFIGSLALLVLLGLLLYEFYSCAAHSRDSLGTYLCIGMMALVGFQSIINLGMNLRLLPVIGITLPLFSAGGSSVATLYLGIGLVLSVSFSERTRRHDFGGLLR
ncbi:MAG: FtsW/RodA/SpoVE family cell cycle protein [Clostridia bacterium]|nr:FtsW/RodA/SpoVE family cell cycle protein [Clostridia bacterium]